MALFWISEYITAGPLSADCSVVKGGTNFHSNHPALLIIVSGTVYDTMGHLISDTSTLRGRM